MIRRGKTVVRAFLGHALTSCCDAESRRCVGSSELVIRCRRRTLDGLLEPDHRDRDVGDETVVQEQQAGNAGDLRRAQLASTVNVRRT
jgi:hypothetical protein